MQKFSEGHVHPRHRVPVRPRRVQHAAAVDGRAGASRPWLLHSVQRLPTGSLHSRSRRQRPRGAVPVRTHHRRAGGCPLRAPAATDRRAEEAAPAAGICGVSSIFSRRPLPVRRAVPVQPHRQRGNGVTSPPPLLTSCMPLISSLHFSQC